MRLIESHHAPLSPTRSDHQILVLPQPVGINQSQSIPSFMNVANIAVCGASVFFTAFLIFICNRCKADIGVLHRPHQPSKTRFFFFRPGQTPNVSQSLPPHSPFTTVDNGIAARTRIYGPGCFHCYSCRCRCRPLLGVAG